jgi:hypothetical protein
MQVGSHLSKGPYAGKPSAVLREEEAAVFDSQPVTQKCMHCAWEWQGSALEGRTIALTHRLEAHPDMKPRRRRHYRATFNPSFQLHPEDHQAIELDRHRRARLHGVQLEE